jgi:predicted flap endonuclease-1-like 5' DNA nuclease
MLIRDILTIVGMLLGAAILGYLIGWFRKDYKIDQMRGYIVSLEDKVNRVQSERNINERLLIDCQTEKKKIESEKSRIEKMLIECQGKLALSEVESVKLKLKAPVKPVVVKEKVATPIKKGTKGKKPKKTVTTKSEDDLKIIEGIGPKIAGILKKAGIDTFMKLSKLNTEKISDLLVKAGGNGYHRYDATTWSKQAQLASEGKFEELKALMDEMKGGKL